MRYGFLPTVTGAVFSVLMALGCGGGSGSDAGSDTIVPDQSPCALLGYGQSLKVANGERCSSVGEDNSSSVVKLSITQSNGDRGVCTGTVISPTAVLTAAHCFAFSRVSGVVITAVDKGQKVRVSASRVAIHPDFWISSQGVLFNDVAVVHTNTSLAPAPVPVLISRAPAQQEESLVAGYGQTDNGGAVVDDVVAGRAVIRSVTDNHIRIDFRDDESHPCQGDSGGALFVEQDGALAVVGVVSQSDPSVSIDQICRRGDITLYTNTQQAGVMDFIFAQVANAGVS